MTGTSDPELLRRLGGDPDAFEAFYRRHVGRIVRFAASRCSGPEDAADVVADVFLAVIDSAARFDGRRDATAWLLGIAANPISTRRRQAYRESNRRSEGSRDDASSSPTTFCDSRSRSTQPVWRRTCELRSLSFPSMTGPFWSS